MGASQKYSLRWNDFNLNVASTFRDLHVRHDFVDVTLACSDGSTLDAHKVILSSVSSYFRDILKTAPCKHPIIILKDTCKDEASAMLEFAYTGEVNVSQELLPSLLHTARCFKIKGLDNVQPPPGLVEQSASSSHQEEWTGSLPPTRPPTPTTHSRPASPPTRPHTPNTRPVSPQSTHPHSPNSVQSSHDLKQFHVHAAEPQLTSQDLKPLQQDVKPFSEHFLALSAGLPAPPRAHHSQPATRSSSPAPISLPGSPQNLQHPQNNARTPPPKRWKRSFDLARNEVPIDDSEEGRQDHERDERLDDRSMDGRREQQHLLHSSESNDFVESDAKRFCEGSKPRGAERYSMEGEKRFVEADSPMKRFVEPGSRVLSYPHSMPASPTMMDGRNHASLSLLSRHFARVGSGDRGEVVEEQQRQSENNHPLDYRFQKDTNEAERREESEAARCARLGFRPESAPTLLDVSPESSLSGIRHEEHGMEHDERLNHLRTIVGTLQPVSSNGQDLSDCVQKALNSGGSGRYSCDECGKLFKHPGSLQHHRHIHRGTHKCPSCGKAFSRRWDMERHLNKSKYGCPANRFSSSGEPLPPMMEPMSVSPMHTEPMEGRQVVTMTHHENGNLVTLIPASMQGATP